MQGASAPQDRVGCRVEGPTLSTCARLRTLKTVAIHSIPRLSFVKQPCRFASQNPPKTRPAAASRKASRRSDFSDRSVPPPRGGIRHAGFYFLRNDEKSR